MNARSLRTSLFSMPGQAGEVLYVAKPRSVAAPFATSKSRKGVQFKRGGRSLSKDRRGSSAPHKAAQQSRQTDGAAKSCQKLLGRKVVKLDAVAAAGKVVELDVAHRCRGLYPGTGRSCKRRKYAHSCDLLKVALESVCRAQTHAPEQVLDRRLLLVQVDRTSSS